MRVRAIVILAALAGGSFAQQRNPPTIPREPLGSGPFVFDTAEQQ